MSDLNDSPLFLECRKNVVNKMKVLHDALRACADYDSERQTVYSRILYFEVEILLTDYITGRTR